MKNKTIFFALVMSTMFFFNQVKAQRVWCEFNTTAFVVTPDPSLGEELRHTTEAALLWIKMDPASDHNKSGEDGGCFLKPYDHKFIAQGKTPVLIPYCANKIVEYKWIKAETTEPVVTTSPKGGKVTTRTITTPNRVVINQTFNTPNGNSQPYAGGGNGNSQPCVDCIDELKDGIKIGKDLYADGVDKGLEAAERGSRIGGSGSGGGNVYSTAPQPQVIQMQQQPQRSGGGNGAAIAGAVLGGAGLIYNIVADVAGVNGRFRRQSGGVTNVNNWNTGTNSGTNPGTVPFGQPGANLW